MADHVADDAAGRAEEAARQALRAAGAAHDAHLAADEVRRAAADFAQSRVGDDEVVDHERRLLEEHGVDPDDPRLDQAIRELEAGATPTQPYGSPGAPASRRSPFRIALQASAGVIVAVAVAVVAYTVRDILVIVLVAMFLATGLNPAVEWLRRHRVPSALAVLTVIVLVLGIVAVTVLAAAPALIRQGNELREELPGYVRQVVSSNQTLRNLDERVGLVERVENVTTGIDAEVLEGPQTRVVVGVALGLAQGVFAVVTALVLTLYFVANFRGIKRVAYGLVPRSRRARVTLLTDEILDRVGRYVLGNLVTSVVAGVSAALFLWALHVPYPAALGLFVALTGLIPLVGATVGGVVACAVAFTVAPSTGFSAVIFFIVYQQFENFFLVPRVMRQAVNVSPAATIVAVLIGATLLGVVGALLAVPMAAAVQLVATEVIVPRQEVQ
jgi:predicted PurR-regulated permease PerM